MDTPASLPDIDELLTTLTEFMEYISQPEMRKLEKSDSNAFEQHLDKKFSDFTYRYYGMFKMLLNRHQREQNLYKILEIIGKLSNVKDGKSTLDMEEEKFKKELNHEYLFSQYGGEKGFEKAMKSRQKR
jgi:hypothetical protein